MTVTAPPLRVALADDSPEARALLQAMLEVVDGVDVVGSAANGAQAVDLVAETHPDLILLDIAMPVMDGLEAATAIRARTPETKIAMYSAFSRARMAPAALAAGADDYVEKAATIDELLTQIRRLFPHLPDLEVRPPARERRAGTAARARGLPARTAEEQRYRMLLDALEEGVLTTDGDGVISDANFVATQVLDASLSRLIGSRLAEIGLDGGSEGARTISEALRTQRPVSGLDCTLTRSDGQLRDLMVSVRPLLDAASLSVHENLVSFVDLTDLRRSERDLVRAEARMRRSFEAILDCLVVLSAVRGKDGAITDFRYEEVNEAACRFNRLDRHQLVGHLLCDVLPAHRTNGLFEKYVEVVEAGDRLDTRALRLSEVLGSGQEVTLLLDLQAVANGDELFVGFRDVTDEARAREELADSERRYRQIIETTQEGVLSTDEELRVVFANARFAELVGWSPEELVGTSMWDYVDDESADDVREGHNRRLRGESDAYEVKLRRKDGTTTWVSTSTSPITDRDGRYAGSLALVTDISERKHAEQQLARSADLLDRTQELSRTGGWEYDATDGRLTWTDEVYRIYGVDTSFDPNDVTSAVAAYDAESAPVIDAAFRRLLSDGETYDLELGLDRADGQHIWVRTVGRPTVEHGRVVRAAGNIIDVTAQHEAQEHLRSSEALFRGGFESSPIGMTLTNPDGTFHRVNAAFADMLGYGPDELVGLPFASITHPDDAPANLAGLQRMLAGASYQTEKRYLRRSGEIVHVLLSSTAVCDEAGTPIMLYTQVQDITDRLRAEEALTSSEQRLHDTFDALTEGLAVFSPVRDAGGRIVDFRIEEINDAGCRLTGASRADLVGRLLGEARPWQRTAGIIDGYAHTVESGEPYETLSIPMEGEFRPGIREKRYFDVRAVVSGTHLIASWSDVTVATTAEAERREVEERLRASEELFREGVGSLLDGFAIISPVRDESGDIVDFRWEYANDASCRRNALAREQMIGRRIGEVLPGYPTTDVFALHRRVAQTGEPARVDDVGWEGEWVPGQVVAKAYDGTVVPYGDNLIVTGRDITDRKRAEAEVRRLTTLLDSSQELTKTGGWEFDVVSGAQLLTQEVYRIYGLDDTNSPLSTADAIAAYDPDSRPVIEAAWRGAVEDGRPYELELKLIRSDGIPVWVRTAGRPEVRDGRVVRVRGTIIDITQEKAARDALERSNRDLEAFASALSHDLREPLRTTAGFVQLISDRYADDLPEPARDLFGYVISGTERMNDRITAILGFARAGAAAAPPHPVDSAAAAAAAVADCDVLITEAGASLDIGPLPVVRADALQLQRVFQNLITNASKYTRPGTTPHITLSAEQLGDHWHFTVADNGPGIPETQRERIFAMFVRGDVEQGHDGHGMGLALCRRIIESYDGHIWVEPNPDGGSLFRFTLPLADRPKVPAPTDP